MRFVDGSRGEGGGQVLRTALALAALRGQPVRLERIRAGRPRPGLQPQHLACVRALAALTGARVEGAQLGSSALTFAPGPVRPGEHRFDIGTAGSTALLLQALLPPLLAADAPSRLELAGGTHVPWSPPFPFLEASFAPALARLGLQVRLRLERCGFYPRGGGLLRAEVAPGSPEGTDLSGPTRPPELRGVSGVCRLPRRIAERQRAAALARLAAGGVAAAVEVVECDGPSPGTFLVLHGDCGCGVPAAFSALGARGKPAERVGEEAAGECLEHLARGGCLEPHLADQLVVYLALAREGGAFTTSRVTRHLLTNLEVAADLLGVPFAVEGSEGRAGRVRIGAAAADPRGSA